MIKIDMEMPENCIDCPCVSVWFGENELENNCGVLHRKIERTKTRPEWCPLIEEDQQSCHNCKHDNTGNENCKLCGIDDEDSEWEPKA